MKKGTIAILTTLVGSIASAGAVYKVTNKKIKTEKELDKKNDTILKVFSQWMQVKQKGRNVSDYLKENGYKTIAIYGMHYLGECLYAELKHSEIDVKYVIDRNAANIELDIDIVTPNDTLAEVDAVIVTPIYYFDEIEEQLSKNMKCPIISLEDIVYEMEL